jgi:hypothetical protein
VLDFKRPVFIISQPRDLYACAGTISKFNSEDIKVSFICQLLTDVGNLDLTAKNQRLINEIATIIGVSFDNITFVGLGENQLTLALIRIIHDALFLAGDYTMTGYDIATCPFIAYYALEIATNGIKYHPNMFIDISDNISKKVDVGSKPDISADHTRQISAYIGSLGRKQCGEAYSIIHMVR